MRGLAVAAVAVLALATDARGQDGNPTGHFNTGNDLYLMCFNNPAGATQYVTGVADTFMLTDMIYQDQTFCPTPAVTAGQLKDIVCKWIIDNPGQRHYVGPSNIFGALTSAFPCQKKPAQVSK